MRATNIVGMGLRPGGHCSEGVAFQVVASAVLSHARKWTHYKAHSSHLSEVTVGLLWPGCSCEVPCTANQNSQAGILLETFEHSSATLFLTQDIGKSDGEDVGKMEIIGVLLPETEDSLSSEVDTGHSKAIDTTESVEEVQKYQISGFRKWGGIFLQRDWPNSLAHY